MANGYKTGGRSKGTPNKITRAFREAVQTVYTRIGGDKAFATWAQDNPTEFYRIAARLIPQEMRHAGADDGPLTVQVIKFSERAPD